MVSSKRYSINSTFTEIFVRLGWSEVITSFVSNSNGEGARVAIPKTADRFLVLQEAGLTRLFLLLVACQYPLLNVTFHRSIT